MHEDDEIDTTREEEVCSQCGRTTCGERCNECDMPLCAGCHEGGVGLCSACHSPNEDITATAGAGHAVESVGEQASGLVLPQLIGDANRQTSCQDCPPTWPVNRAHGSRGG